MWQMQALDVAIGLFLMYLLFSLACSTAAELLSGLVSIRAYMLWGKVKEMLGDANARELYEMILIKPGKQRPAYVQARDFSLALLEVVSPSSPTSPPRVFFTLRSSVVDKSKIAESELAKLLADPNASQNAKRTAEAHVRSLKAILALVDDAGHDLAKAKENIEHWFDSTMERMTGAYKRHAQTAILVLGLAITIGLNADTIAICRTLWTDAPVRSALVAAATQVVQAPAGDSLAKAAPVPTLAQVQQGLEGIELPLGWQFEHKPAAGQSKPPHWGLSFWALKILGWLITALAISLGAPFWFDLLGRLVQVRSSLKPKPAAES